MLLLYLLAAVPLLIFFFLRKYAKKPHNSPPGPPGIPYVGNLHQLEMSNFHLYLMKLASKYGPIFSMKLGYRHTIVISSAEVAEEALKTNDVAFASRPQLAAWRKLSYDGNDMAFAPYNAYWREIRKLSTVHLFTAKRIQSFRSLREDELGRMLAKISKAAAERKPIDISDITLIFAVNLISRSAFGKRHEEDGKEAERFHHLLHEIQAVFMYFFFQDYFHNAMWLDKLTGNQARLEKIYKDMDDFIQELIDEHLDKNRKKQDVEDFIDVLIGIRNEKNRANEFTWEQVKGIVMNVFVAGTDTGATNLVWGLTAMMQYPRVMKKVQEEIRSVMGDKGFIVEEDVNQLPYLKAVVKELMRLYPATPLLVPKETNDKTKIAGYDVPAGTLVYVNAYAMGRDPKTWENPNEFYPERFIGKDIDFKGTDFELIPFGAGRRICPGMNLGILTVEVGLANLLYAFDWELPQGMKREDIDLSGKPGIVMHKDVPLKLVPKRHVHSKY